MTTTPIPSEPCPECGGKTIEFRGNTVETAEFKVCSRYREPGHLSTEEIRAKRLAEGLRLRPSGRFA